LFAFYILESFNLFNLRVAVGCDVRTFNLIIEISESKRGNRITIMAFTLSVWMTVKDENTIFKWFKDLKLSEFVQSHFGRYNKSLIWSGPVQIVALMSF